MWQLVVAHLRSGGVVQEPVGSTADGGETDIGSDNHVTEKQPRSDQGLFGWSAMRREEIEFVYVLRKRHDLDSWTYLGGLVMMSKSGGLKPKAVAGKPSVTKLTHKSWTGIKASGRPRAAVKKMETTSPMLEEIK